MKQPVNDKTCGPCIEGQASLLPFTLVQRPRLYRIGEMTHIDIAGSENEEGLEREKYFQVIVDDFSHFKTVYILSNKSKAA